MKRIMASPEIMANLQIDVYAANRSLELYQGLSDCPTMADIDDLLDLFNVSDYDYTGKDAQL